MGKRTSRATDNRPGLGSVATAVSRASRPWGRTGVRGPRRSILDPRARVATTTAATPHASVIRIGTRGERAESRDSSAGVEPGRADRRNRGT